MSSDKSVQSKATQSKNTDSKVTSRRKFMLTAGAAGAATVAMPQVSRAQTVTWKYQSTWPSKDIFHEDVDEADLRRKLREAHHAVTISDFNLRHLRERLLLQH